MVQIISENRRPSFSERLGRGLIGAGQVAAQGYAQQMMQEQQERRMGNELAAKEQRELNKIRLQEGLRGASQKEREQLRGSSMKELELMRQAGKEKLLGQKQALMGQLFGGTDHPSSASIAEHMGFNPAEIPDEVIMQAAAIDPQMARIIAQQKDVAIRERRAAEEKEFREKQFGEQQRKATPEYAREQKLSQEQAAADSKYHQELQSSSKQHEIKSQTLDRLEKLNKKGVTGRPYEKLLEKFGLVSLTSEGRREFAADVKNLITDIRSILGSQFSQFEFQTILNAYPSADFSQEANEAIIRNLKEFQGIRKKEFEIANSLKKENGGKIPLDFQSKVNDRLQEYVQSKLPEIKDNTRKILEEEYEVPKGHILMLDLSGEPLFVPEEEVEEALSIGAQMP